jgi:hypothetical protein
LASKAFKEKSHENNEVSSQWEEVSRIPTDAGEVASQPFRFRVSVADEKIVIWLEDRQTKHPHVQTRSSYAVLLDYEFTQSPIALERVDLLAAQ